MSKSSLTTTSLFLGLIALTCVVEPLIFANPQAAVAQNAETYFPDTKDHWAQPFIKRLAERSIVTGYPDGTYRPNESVDRDEFAAIIRQAFNQNQERKIASGSVYKDVPNGYWAAPAIEEAYEMGFMHGFPGGYFRPRQPVSRVEALVALAQNLNLTTAVATQPNNPQTTRRQLLFPIGMTNLMQPLMTAQAVYKTAAASSPPVPASTLVSNYYTDAQKIPQYAVDEVAEATKAGIVVNHPDPKVLNPTKPATRGAIAAFIYQALVNQGRLEPLPSNIQAANYIVRPSELSSNNPQEANN
ncbi:S-layer homology domain-containing protein [Calothrix anomala FACHB-343]|uniref:S-layer homology domain-containing protein n=2 Tax=Calothrix TaxID=1186 RepID=A0ABR8AJV6_9CYAN|nr:S-layer homology domain-containing protein [Calothrix parietina FACHB-288]MBD2228294.1 S-layer homology domain-containing protein [Calothrix anomala FACHB-343]